MAISHQTTSNISIYQSEEPDDHVVRPLRQVGQVPRGDPQRGQTVVIRRHP